MVIVICICVFLFFDFLAWILWPESPSSRDYWKRNSKGCKCRLSFDQFLAFYKKKSESWDLGAYTVTYRDKHTVAFQSYRDWKRYRRWKKHISKWQEEDEVERATGRLLREIQNDYMPAPPSVPPAVRRKDKEVTKNG